MRAPLAALMGLGLATAVAAAGNSPGRIVTPLRPLRGGNLAASEAEVATFGHSNAPQKRVGAFKIARVLSQSILPPPAQDKPNSKKLEAIGYKDMDVDMTQEDDPFLVAYVNLKLAACGATPVKMTPKEEGFLRLVEPILKTYQEQQHLLCNQGLSLCPADQRLQNFIDDYFGDVDGQAPKLPTRQLKLDRHGLSKMLSLPKGKDLFQNSIISSYRVSQGVLHNPKNDKRTTKGVFHVCDGGLPVSGEKKIIPKLAFKRLFDRALDPPEDLLTVPYTSNEKEKTSIFASLLLRPLLSPEVPGFMAEKTAEVRFIVPGSMVCNLDFVESIFGNGDNPDLAENDAALDPEHWSGTSGLVILAPHLVTVKAKDLGLPHKNEATERQLRDGMFWEKPDDLYNGGSAFKICARDARGVVVTIIADNYFGYCKKEVKTQLGFAANLYGMAEEEHAGGCIAYPAFDLGEVFDASTIGKVAPKGNAAFLGKTHAYLCETQAPRTFKDTVSLLGDTIDVMPEGYAIDKQYPDVWYMPENAVWSMPKQSITWHAHGKEQKVNLKPRTTYILPNGYKVEMVKKGSNVVSKKRGGETGQYEKWHLKGTVAEGANCHKPATVSGGGKSEISKRLQDMIKYGPVFVSDISKDFDRLEELFKKDYSNVCTDKSNHPLDGSTKSLLDPSVSLGNIIKLFTPQEYYTEEHNAFVKTVPTHLRELLAVIKQNYKPEWGDDWRAHFHTDAINGDLGHELKYGNDFLLSSYMRVGFRSTKDQDIPLKHDSDGTAWRTFTLRQDFFPCDKLQTEDDITASVVVPEAAVKSGLWFRSNNPSYKFSQNCEFRLFQRPDEAVHRGFDKICEMDMAKPGNFISNFEPNQRVNIQKIVDDTVGFEKFSQPMQDRLLSFLENDNPEYCVSSAHSRIVDGKPTANPRYLQDSMEVTDTRAFHVGYTGTRLARQTPLGMPVFNPVNAYLCGRRNNAPDAAHNVPALAVHNPVHYYELPELLMELASSMTGKSPSTTGAGSEGALTKGPFNMLSQVHDLNNALVSYSLMNAHVFISSAGVIGPYKQVDHDISLLVPEVWSRMREEERDANWLIKNGFLEKINDMEIDGKHVPASLLGYRINEKFVKQFFGRVLANPSTVFDEDVIRPEKQDAKIFADGMKTITDTNARVAKMYIEDGGAEMACPPLKALLYIMAHGEYEGMTKESPEFRAMFTRESILASDWYKERLQTFQTREVERCRRGIDYLEQYLGSASQGSDWKGRQVAHDLQLEKRLSHVKEQLAKVEAPTYLETIKGSLGVDPAIYKAPGNNLDRPVKGARIA